MIKRFLLSAVLLLTGLAHADWAADRAASAGYVTVTTLASVIDEAVPFCVVNLSDLPTGFHTAMSTASDTDGKTIRVSTSDGSTQLACVPLGVNTGTDTGCLIFLGTGMSASVNVDYRIYVGNASLTMPTASGGMGEQAVFAAYVQVYFPGMDTRNFASSSFTPLVAVGTPTTGTSGVEGITAAAYNGTSQYHYYSGTQGVTNWPITVEALTYTTTTSATAYAVALGRSTDANPFAFLDFDTVADHLAASVRGDTSSAAQGTDTNTYSTSTWYYAAGNRDANTGTTRNYVNGAAAGTNAGTVTAPIFDRLGIGALIRTTVAGYLPGRVAAVLLSDSVRSANFIATQNQNWLGNLYSVGTWTSNSTSFSMLPILTEE